MRYCKHLTAPTPQSEALLNNTIKQIKNDAGMYVFKAEDEVLLRRFLLLGTEEGTYYAGEHKLTQEAAKHILNMLQVDGEAVLKITHQMVKEKSVPKHDPALFILTLACASINQDTRQYAYTLIPKLCQTSTHLFMFLSQVLSLRGWSRGLRTAVGNFYMKRSDTQIAYQVLKYRNRAGWSHRDVLRQIHLKPDTNQLSNIFQYIVGKYEPIKHRTEYDQLPSLILQYEAVKNLSSLDLKLDTLRKGELTWEMIPTNLLKEPKVWEILAGRLPYIALLRNLGRMSSLGILGSKVQGVTSVVTERLLNKAVMQDSKVHPAAILNALINYGRGYGEKGKLRWTPSPAVLDALEQALDLAAATQVPTNRRILLAVDVSGSMQGSKIAGMSITPAQAAAAMASTILKTEPKAELAWFHTTAFLAKIGAKNSYQEILQAAKIGGGTDCSAPFRMALDEKLEYDAIIVLTDSQTTGGSFHPIEAWEAYKTQVNPKAKVVLVGMAANEFSLFPPTDPSAITITGFDTTALQIITEFINS